MKAMQYMCNRQECAVNRKECMYRVRFFQERCSETAFKVTLLLELKPSPCPPAAHAKSADWPWIVFFRNQARAGVPWAPDRGTHCCGMALRGRQSMAGYAVRLTRKRVGQEYLTDFSQVFFLLELARPQSCLLPRIPLYFSNLIQD